MRGAPPARRRKTAYRPSQGLVPTYRGYTPRSFGRGEWKYIETDAMNLTADTTPVLTLVNGVTMGTSAANRVGQSITMRSLQLRLVNAATPATGTDQIHRLLLVLDRQANGTAPTLPDILYPGGTLFTMRNLDNRKRFKILWDKTIVLDASGEPGTIRFTKMYLKFRRPVTVDFNGGNAGSIGDITSNSLYLCLLGSNAPGNTAGICQGNVRVRFTDQ